ncbi:LIM domain-binding protein 2-like isoform X5 [Cherax quadricarinatus]|uniref:LIM domain-binding protein 2-like isoform X5 n=1 Tax=Cherax quadricarinatus TaxID=27406 RepID=UPI00387EBEEC
MPIKTGRRKQPVTTGLGAPGDHDGLPPAPHMMPGAVGPQGPLSGDTAPVGPANMPHGPQGGPVGLGSHPGHVPPGAPAFMHGPGGPGMPGGPVGPGGPGPISSGPGGPGMASGPGMPGHGMPNGPQMPSGPNGPGMMPGPGGPGPGMPMHGPGGPPGPINPAFFSCFCCFRRHTPYFGQPDYRLYELNKRLQQRSEESDNLWWDAFATEFFEDDATLTLTFCLEDGPKRYTIGRTLIPRYFRSIFEGGVTELYYSLKHPKESFHNTSITLDCDQCTMVTHHGKPMYTKVCADGRLILEFTFDDLMRIKSWHFAVRAHRELIPRSVVAMHSQQDPGMVETLSKNITRQGITSHTLNYLRLCVILEPMQELMSRHKAYALSPRDCLKTTLFQKWQRMVAPPGLVLKTSPPSKTQRAPNKRRKRKGSQSGQNATANSTGSSKKRSPGPNFSLATQVSQDVMVVGEPSLMGGEFGDEDERLITRLENTQYDTTGVEDGGNGGAPQGAGPGGPGPGPAGPTPFNNSPMTAGPGGPWPDPARQPQETDKKSPAISNAIYGRSMSGAT